MKLRFELPACFAGAAVLVGLGAWLSFGSFRQVEHAGLDRERSFSLLTLANGWLSSLKDAETGYRGYLLTRDEAYLEPYARVRDSLRGTLGILNQLTLDASARTELDGVAPELEASLAKMAEGIERRRTGNAAPAEGLGPSKRLMDSIRSRMQRYLQLEQDLRTHREKQFQANLRRMLLGIWATSLLTLLLALAVAYSLYQESRRRFKQLVYRGTLRLLEGQKELNGHLERANAALQENEELLRVTLHSIGDAVLTTDNEGHLKTLNSVAEQITGWTQAEAAGRPVDEAFHLISQETRQPAVIPVRETLAKGTIHGLANHTILVARDGRECAIADSCAPIRDRAGQVIGAVMVFRDVTQDYARQQALRESSALVKMVLDTVADGIITLDVDGSRVETANPAAERMFGYAAGELAGQPFGLLLPELGMDPWDGVLERSSESGGLRQEVEGRRKDGARFTLEMRVSEMWLGSQRHFTGIFSDITQRKGVEEQLRWTGESFRLMVESVVDYAIVMLDPEGRVVSWNGGAQRLKGYRDDEILGQHFSRFYSLEDVDRGKPQQDLDLVIAQGRFEDEGWRARKDGSAFWANEVFTAIRDQDGNLRGFANLTQDLTERRRVEAELTQAKAMAEKANLAKSYFLSSMSHELRSPLNGILGFAQLLETETPPPRDSQKESIAQILKAGWHLLTLINEILDLAKVESGQVPMSQEPVSMAEVLLECQGMMEPQAKVREIRLDFRRSDQRYFVLADRTRVKQVLLNLVSNAIKYNVDRGTITVECVDHGDGRVRVSVRDTGRGLAPNQVAQLFQPFNRLGQEAGGAEGTGIGLVVAKRLVELMDGVIGVESTVGVGSVFWFDLLAVAEPELVLGDPGLGEPVPAPPGPNGVHLRTVLYVEDNPANLKLVELIIARHPNLRLLTAVNGNSGIELARESKVDVILLDINLPGMNGFEVLKFLRSNPATAAIPVLAVSANAMPTDVENGMRAGFFRYITKPIKVNEFMEGLNEALACSEPSAP